MVINPVEQQDVPAVLDFVLRARSDIFPMLEGADLPADLANFAQVYLEDEGGHFLIARCDGQIVAAIGYLPYDKRFGQLDLGQRRVVEIVRLFVIPAFRRSGLATRIFLALKAHAMEQGVEVLYLHTHPFLPGAVGFWQRQGFEVIDVEDDPVWRTTHMACGV
ncbi:GNAT family N-acetyltransferase [Pseudomonas sp. DWP3-1-2]|uniref:GNAT family N-acetyltransferase n=1 Tax=Pseudomonas sp. DWP3-1-2 TaxID=2804645 RepID=UPI003CFB2EDB